MELFFCLLVSIVGLTAGMGARSFPVQAENETTDKFKQVNPSMEIDETNFLVDLSGLYAQCDVANTRQSGEVQVTRKTADGATVYGRVDFVEGNAIDTDSLVVYIRNLFEQWTDSRNDRKKVFRDQILASNRYGCSVRPGCRGYAVIACMFASV